MASDVQKLLDTFADLREQASVNACFGEPVKLGDRTVIPIANAHYGFWMSAVEGATSEAETEIMEKMGIDEGRGGGFSSAPLGIVEVTEDGTRIEPVIDEQRVTVIGMLVAAWSVFWLFRALTAIFGRRE